MNCFNGPQTLDIQKLLDQIEQLKQLKQTMSNTNEIALANKDLLERYDTLFGLLDDESTKGCLMHNIHNSTGGRRSRRSKNKKARSKKRSHK